MEKIIKEFLKSDLDESKFFGISYNDEIYLNEYLEHMKDVDFKFQKMAMFEIESIKKKCPWVDQVWFKAIQNSRTKEFFLESIHLFPIDGREICTDYNGETDTFSGSIKGVPVFYLLNKNVRVSLERQKDISLIQDELKEITSIGRYLYDCKLNRKKSITKIFDIIYRPDSGLYVFCDHELVTLDAKNVGKNYDKPLVKNSNKVLKKILVKE